MRMRFVAGQRAEIPVLNNVPGEEVLGRRFAVASAWPRAVQRPAAVSAPVDVLALALSIRRTVR